MAFGAALHGFVQGFKTGYDLVQSPEEKERARLEDEYRKAVTRHYEQQTDLLPITSQQAQERIDIDRERMETEKLGTPAERAAAEQRRKFLEGVGGGSGGDQSALPVENVAPVATTGAVADTDVASADAVIQPVTDSLVDTGEALSFVPEEYRQAFRDTGEAYGLNPVWHANLIRKESRFNPDALSPKGAEGLAQIMPGTAPIMGVDPSDPYQSIVGSGRYLRELIDKFGNETDALVAYHNGEKGAADWIANGRKFSDLGPEAQDYLTVLDTGDAVEGDPLVDVADKKYIPEMAAAYAAQVGLPPAALAVEEMATGGGEYQQPVLEDAGPFYQDQATEPAAFADERLRPTADLTLAGGMGPYQPAGVEATTGAEEAALYVTPEESQQEVNVAAEAIPDVANAQELVGQTKSDVDAYFSPGGEQAIPTPESDKAEERKLDGYGGAVRSLVADADQVLKEKYPDMSPDVRKVMAFKEVELFHQGNGDAASAKNARIELYQYYQNEHNKWAGIAEAAAEDGNVEGTARALAEKYANIPDGSNVDFINNKDGTVTMVVTEGELGNVTTRKVMSPDEVFAEALNWSPEDFGNRLAVYAGATPAEDQRAFQAGMSSLSGVTEIPGSIGGPDERARAPGEPVREALNTGVPPLNTALMGQMSTADQQREYRLAQESAMKAQTERRQAAVAAGQESTFQRGAAGVAGGRLPTEQELAGMTKEQADRVTAMGQQAAFERGMAALNIDESGTVAFQRAGPPDEGGPGPEQGAPLPADRDPTMVATEYIYHKGSGELSPLPPELVGQMGPLATQYTAARDQMLQEWKDKQPKEVTPLTYEQKATLQGDITETWTTMQDEVQGSVDDGELDQATKDLLDQHAAEIQGAAFEIYATNEVSTQDAILAARNMVLFTPDPDVPSHGHRGWIATYDPETESIVVQFNDGDMVSMSEETYKSLKAIQDNQINALRAQEAQAAETEAGDVLIEGQENARRATEDYEYGRKWTNIPATMPPVTDPTIRPIPSFGAIGRGY